MRLKTILAAMAALVGFAWSAPDRAWADGYKTERRHCCAKHRAHYPWRYVHLREDPYAYQYSPRGYYPYYGSAYWAPAGYIKLRNRVHANVWNEHPPYYEYYKSWGYPKHWHHRKWHAYHHGRHHRWHW